VAPSFSSFGTNCFFLCELLAALAFKGLILMELRVSIGKQSGYKALNAMPQVPDGRCGVERAGYVSEELFDLFKE
jgi:hypothetical protein